MVSCAAAGETSAADCLARQSEGALISGSDRAAPCWDVSSSTIGGTLPCSNHTRVRKFPFNKPQVPWWLQHYLVGGVTRHQRNTTRRFPTKRRRPQTEGNNGGHRAFPVVSCSCLRKEWGHEAGDAPAVTRKLQQVLAFVCGFAWTLALHWLQINPD